MTAKWSRRFFVPANKVGSNDAAELDCQQRKAVKSRNQNRPHRYERHTITPLGEEAETQDLQRMSLHFLSSVLSMTVVEEQFFIQQQKQVAMPLLGARENVSFELGQRPEELQNFEHHVHQINLQSVLMILKSLQYIKVSLSVLN
jgi:hypothetical protein